MTTRIHKIFTAFFFLIGVFLIGCEETNLAPSGTIITVQPNAVDLGSAGINGDRTFLAFVATATNQNGNPVPGLDMAVNIDALVAAGGVFIFNEETLAFEARDVTDYVADDNGQIVFTLSVPLAVDFSSSPFVTSGGVASDSIDISAGSVGEGE